MSEALRDTEGKLDWAMLFEYFPLAMPELCRAREFGASYYTKDGKDGRSNWLDSINTERHEAFMKGCVRGNISHNFKFLWGKKRDEVQDNVHHLAFSALNAMMALEYDLSVVEVELKYPNLKRRDEMPEWLIDLIHEESRLEDLNKDRVLFMFEFKTSLHGTEFWVEVDSWQSSATKLPARPTT